MQNPNTVKRYARFDDTIRAIKFADDAETICNIDEFVCESSSMPAKIGISYERPDEPALRIHHSRVHTAAVGDYVVISNDGLLSVYPGKKFEETYGNRVVNYDA